MVGTLAKLVNTTAADSASTADKQTGMIRALADLISSSSAGSASETTTALHADMQCDVTSSDGSCNGDGEHILGTMVAYARNLVPTEASAPHTIYTCDFTFASRTSDGAEVKLAEGASSTTAAAVAYVPASDSAYKVTCRLPVLSGIAVGTELNVAFALKAGCRTIALPKCSSGPWLYKVEKIDREFYYLVVGGGGGGGGGHESSTTNYAGGGGGAGGYKSNMNHDTVSLSPGDKLIATVGKGGASRTYDTLQNGDYGWGGTGGASSLTIEYASAGKATATYAVDGGGGGGDGGGGGTHGNDGGSGGGGSGAPNTVLGGSATGFGTGHAGGRNNGNRGAAGGGGAGAPGNELQSDGHYTGGALGGAGLKNAITGQNVEYARGGSGGNWHEGGATDPEVPFTGEGGQGARGEVKGFTNWQRYSRENENSAAGGSGVVIIRIPTKAYTGKTTGDFSVTASGAWSVVTFRSDGTYIA